MFGEQGGNFNSIQFGPVGNFEGRPSGLTGRVVFRRSK